MLVNNNNNKKKIFIVLIQLLIKNLLVNVEIYILYFKNIGNDKEYETFHFTWIHQIWLIVLYPATIFLLMKKIEFKLWKHKLQSRNYK